MARRAMVMDSFLQRMLTTAVVVVVVEVVEVVAVLVLVVEHMAQRALRR